MNGMRMMMCLLTRRCRPCAGAERPGPNVSLFTLLSQATIRRAGVDDKGKHAPEDRALSACSRTNINQKRPCVRSGQATPSPAMPSGLHQARGHLHLYCTYRRRPLSRTMHKLMNMNWKGRDSNPRPRHYERVSWLKVTCRFNNLPRAPVATWHNEARLPQISRTIAKRTGLPW